MESHNDQVEGDSLTWLEYSSECPEADFVLHVLKKFLMMNLKVSIILTSLKAS